VHQAFQIAAVVRRHEQVYEACLANGLAMG
jgi:hypothetical protein